MSIVIPAYNEQEAVGVTIESVRHILDGAGIPHEIIVVIDGSRDGTLARAPRVFMSSIFRTMGAMAGR